MGDFLLREFLEILPPTIFFFIGFNLIMLTTNLILAELRSPICQLHFSYRGGIDCREGAIGRPPLRPCAADPPDPIQNRVSLGGGLHRPPHLSADNTYSAAFCRTR